MQTLPQTMIIQFVTILTISLIAFACEEEETIQRPVVSRAIVQKAATQNQVDLSKYNQAGNGPTKAPDWIASQDLSLMRRYSLNEPNGFRNGVEFKPQAIWVEHRESGWVLVMNEYPLSYPTQLTMKGQRVEILLNGEPSAQYQTQVNNEESKATWRIPSSKIEGKTKAWVAKSEYSLELLQWFVKPYDTKGPVFQEAGKASGRLMIQFVDEQNVQGWLVGKFDNVLVRYMGDPAKW